MLTGSPPSLCGWRSFWKILEKETSKAVVKEPGHIFESGDRVRFRFAPNFSGTLFVMDRGTSGSYTMLFPKEDTGTDDRMERGPDRLIHGILPAGPARHAFWCEANHAATLSGVPARPADGSDTAQRLRCPACDEPAS